MSIKENLTQNKIPIAIFVAFVSIAHILIPLVSEKGDFFIFFNWNLYAAKPSTSLVDLTWDGGNTYFLRNRELKDKRTGANYYLIRHLVLQGEVEIIAAEHIEGLLDLCQCKEIEAHTLKASLFDHLIKKIEPNIIERRKL